MIEQHDRDVADVRDRFDQATHREDLAMEHSAAWSSTASARSGRALQTREAKNHAARFVPVFDSRKSKIRGLVRRGSHYYAQMRIATPDGKTRPVRVPLKATTLDGAKKEAEEKRTQNRKGQMHLPGHRPKFEKLVSDYQKSAEFLVKKQGTRENEIQALNRWIAHLGGVRIDWIKPNRMTSFRDLRMKQGVSARTINLDLVAFNNAMAYAITRLAKRIS